MQKKNHRYHLQLNVQKNMTTLKYLKKSMLKVVSECCMLSFVG